MSETFFCSRSSEIFGRPGGAPKAEAAVRISEHAIRAFRPHSALHESFGVIVFLQILGAVVGESVRDRNSWIGRGLLCSFLRDSAEGGNWPHDRNLVLMRERGRIGEILSISLLIGRFVGNR